MTQGHREKWVQKSCVSFEEGCNCILLVAESVDCITLVKIPLSTFGLIAPLVSIVLYSDHHDVSPSPNVDKRVTTDPIIAPFV